MIKADLHVHSSYSEHPSEWFLQRIGARESYTSVETIHAVAKRRGMSFVTVSDRNRIEGSLELVEKHPRDSFVSCETTAYFPEDGCKIHILAYDITGRQFADIQEARRNIYELRDYLREQDIACSVAHATYNVNGQLGMVTLEKLILLFDVFEGINGARSRLYNDTWMETLRSLTPADIDRLHDKHKIDPWSEDPWKKGFTGGSDDHSGLLIGETFTCAEARTLDGLIQSIKTKSSSASGRSGDHKSLTFAVYKIACDYSRTRGGGVDSALFSLLNSLLFDNKRLGLRNWATLQIMKLKKDSAAAIVNRLLDELTDRKDWHSSGAADDRLNRLYGGLATLLDEFLTMIATSLEKELQSGDAGRFLKNVSAAIPAVFLGAPFFSTMHHMHRDRGLMRELQAEYCMRRAPKDKRVLWFTDTLTDLNGVAVTMREVARCAWENGRALSVVTTLPEKELGEDLPPNVLNLPCIYTVTPDFYTSFTLRIPSVLKAIDLIAAQEPDEIIVSTPGPVGLLGLAASRLLDVKCTGIYHTDFTRQVDLFIGDEWVSSGVEAYTKWFYKLMDEVRVPTETYIKILAGRGLDASRMKMFRRAVEPGFASTDRARQESMRRRYGIPDGTMLLWAGRVGREKNLDFLMDVYRDVSARRSDVNLLVVGDGPELERLKRSGPAGPRLIFTGRLDRSDLPHLYGLADAFVFPSTTDTFGMVILEAQACGLPVVVTDIGGPQELVVEGETGYVLSATDRGAWVETIVRLIDMKERAPEKYRAMREKAGACHAGFRWEDLVDDMMGPRPDAEALANAGKEIGSR